MSRRGVAYTLNAMLVVVISILSKSWAVTTEGRNRKASKAKVIRLLLVIVFI